MAPDLNKLAESVHLLQTDMAQVGLLVDRLDITIEKLTEVSSNVSQLLAVQGNRLEYQEKIAEKMQDLVESRRKETDESIKAIYNHIEKKDEENKKDMTDNRKTIVDEIQQLRKEGFDRQKTLSDRMTKFEKIIWTFMGGIGVITFLLNQSQLSLSKIF
jgi:Na+/phosphate symporter